MRAWGETDFPFCANVLFQRLHNAFGRVVYESRFRQLAKLEFQLGSRPVEVETRIVFRIELEIAFLPVWWKRLVQKEPGFLGKSRSWLELSGTLHRDVVWALMLEDWEFGSIFLSFLPRYVILCLLLSSRVKGINISDIVAVLESNNIFASLNLAPSIRLVAYFELAWLWLVANDAVSNLNFPPNYTLNE